jgi:hypothetical protein
MSSIVDTNNFTPVVRGETRDDAKPLVIESKHTTSDRSYDAPITELWLTLPSGRKIYFMDIEHSEWSSVEQCNAAVNKMKEEIITGLIELMRA